MLGRDQSSDRDDRFVTWHRASDHVWEYIGDSVVEYKINDVFAGFAENSILSAVLSIFRRGTHHKFDIFGMLDSFALWVLYCKR